MVHPPDEIITLILHKLDIIDFCRMMLVCKQWNSILDSTKALWRKVELLDDNPVHSNDRLQQEEQSHSLRMGLLQVASQRSGKTLEVYRNSHRLGGKQLGPILTLLELSKFTLREIQVGISEYGLSKRWIQLGNLLGFFKSFANLERLNLTTKRLPPVEPIEKGKLICLVWEEPKRNDDKSSVPIGDVKWLSHLRYLDYQDSDHFKTLPDNLLDILEVCSQNLVELRISDGDHVSERLLGRTLQLVSLEKLTVELPMARDTFDWLGAPNLKELTSAGLSPLISRFENLTKLGLFIGSYQFYVRAMDEQHQKIVDAIHRNGKNLRELQLHPAFMRDSTRFDLLLLHLYVDPHSPTSCSNLSTLVITQVKDAPNPNHKSYNEQMLAKILLSRRLILKSADPKPRKGEGLLKSNSVYTRGSYQGFQRGR